jgi:hypothetical protein
VASWSRNELKLIADSKDEARLEQLVYEHQRPGRMLASELRFNHRLLLRGATMSARTHVVIIGGGFGGLSAAQTLKRAPVDVTLIDRRNCHLFQPLLYQVAAGSLSPGEISAPLRGVLSKQKNARVLLGERNATFASWRVRRFSLKQGPSRQPEAGPSLIPQRDEAACHPSQYRRQQ